MHIMDRLTNHLNVFLDLQLTLLVASGVNVCSPDNVARFGEDGGDWEKDETVEEHSEVQKKGGHGGHAGRLMLVCRGLRYRVA